MLDRMLAGRTGLSPVMVGRTSPLSRLTGLMDASPRDEPAVALVVGEAGVGKTRLLREFTSSLHPSVVVVAAQAERGSLGRPFELALEAIGLDGAPEGPEGLVLVVHAYLERLKGAAVVIFEDLHWADAESLAVFERIAAVAPPSTVLIGSYRPDELTRLLPAAELLERLERRRTVHHLVLEGLDQAQVADFLASVYGRALPSQIGDALHVRTGGNPFFLEEILSAAGDVAPDQIASQPLPFTLAEIVRRQLDGLSRDQRTVIDAAAVLSRSASFDVLSTVTRMTESELIGHLRALVDRGLIIEDRPDEFVFRHALVRDAVEDQLLGRERRRLHETALAVLKGSANADLAELAKHAAGAGRYDEFLDLAREGALHYLERGSSYPALRLATDALGEDPDCVPMLETATRAAWLVGLNEEALGHATRWRERADAAGDLATQAAAARMVARILWELGRFEEHQAAVAEVERLAGLLPVGPDRARAYAAVAQAHMLAKRCELAVEWSNRAIDEADACGAKEVRALAIIEKGSALSDHPPSRAEAIATLRQGIAEAEIVGDHVNVARAFHNMLGVVSLHTREGRGVIEALDAACERAGFDAMLRWRRSGLQVEVAVSDGDMATAQEGLARTAPPTGGPVQGDGDWPAVLQMSLWLEQGRVQAAEELAAQMLESRAFEQPWELAFAVHLAERRGDRVQVEVALRRFADQPLVHQSPGAESSVVPIEAALRIGLPVAVVRELSAPLVVLGNGAPWTPLIEAMLLAAESEHERALESFDAVLALDEPELPANLLAYAALGAARCRLALGDRAEAMVLAERALALLDRWPGYRRDEVLAFLQPLGRAAQADGTDPSELTPREREVAALVARGLTNAALARELYISPRTAAVHVSNILAKLGLANRSELTAWAVRAGVAAG